MKTSRSDAGRGAWGFTLLELLVALAILGLALTALGNVMRVPGGAEAVTSASRAAANLLVSARAEAIASGVPTGVVIDEETASMRLPRLDRGIDLGDGVRLSARVAREAGPRDRPTILFFPDGSSTGGTLAFARDESVARIRVHWLTGAIDVVD